jgi:prepilin-type N-terminal cleavage/methylation domain-containing protein
MKIKRTYRAFTLVELLVVIGIIALLISVLLPALNKARQQANSLACLSNEHQMGLMLAMYESENNGWMPYGYAGDPIAANRGQYSWGWWNTPTWTWCDSLSIMMSRRRQSDGGQWVNTYSWNQPNVANMAYDYSPIFHDKDMSTAGWAVRASDYTANPRVMGSQTDPDGYWVNQNQPNAFCGQRKISSIRFPADVMDVWCGAPYVTGSGTDTGCFEVGDQIDSGNISTNVGMVLPQSSAVGYQINARSARISLGTSGAAGCSFNGTGTGDTIQSLRLENHDVTVGYSNVSMRFRHMNNHNVSGLFCDGHAESRVLGNVLGGDIYTSPPPSPTYGPGL